MSTPLHPENEPSAPANSVHPDFLTTLATVLQAKAPFTTKQLFDIVYILDQHEHPVLAVQDKTYQEVMRILTQPKLCESCHGSGSRSPIPSQFNGVCARCRGSGKAPPT